MTTTLLETRLALALQAARLGTWTWDMGSGTTAWDTRLEELHGLAPGGFGGTFEDWLESLYPEDRAECLARVERALADPGPYILLHRTIWPDGSIHYVECRGTVLTDGDGAPIGTTGVAIDVTERERHKAAASAALARERELVNVLQQALLPPSLPHVPGTKIAVRYIAAQGETAVGGDWYAVLPLPDGRLGLGIGDVAGHGLHAVADMASARFSLRALALTEPSAPEIVLGQLNDVVRVFSRETMITALFGVLDPADRSWTFANAGHCAPLVRNADGTTCWMDDRRDPPLGVTTAFHRQRAVIDPGATLVVYTDGLVERRTESIDEGMRRLRVACEEGPSDAEELCVHLCDVMLRDTLVRDDVAVVVVTLA